MKKIVLYIIMLTMFFSSCKEDKGVLLPTVTGAAYDLLVVGNPSVWKDTAGRELFNLLDEDTPGLPQSEPLFDISFIPSSQFDAVLKPARNILLYDINEQGYTQGKVTYKRNRWAKIQAIVQITAPNQEEMAKVIRENGAQIVDFFVNKEYERSLEYYRRYSNGKNRELIRKVVGVDISIPDFLNKSKEGENFVWVSNGSLDSRQDVVVYRTPYHGPADFSKEKLVAMRDSVLKIYIEGPSEGSYMGTDTINCELTYKEMMVDDHYCTEIRGLWRVQGDFMGGPFVSRSYYDDKQKNMVTVETFVYAPQHKKRNKIRLMEAITTNVEFQ